MRKHSVDSPIINATGEHGGSIKISTDTLENGKVIYKTAPAYDEFYKHNNKAKRED